MKSKEDILGSFSDDTLMTEGLKLQLLLEVLLDIRDTLRAINDNIGQLSDKTFHIKTYS